MPWNGKPGNSSMPKPGKTAARRSVVHFERLKSWLMENAPAQGPKITIKTKMGIAGLRKPYFHFHISLINKYRANGAQGKLLAVRP
jgi:hypothetical protein